MSNKNTFTKILAILGTVLAWFPIAAPVLLTVGFLVVNGRFRFDYLMPAELSLVVLLGGGLLLWAAFRARSRQRLIGWALAAAVVFLVGSQALAVVTGLAHGEMEPTGVSWVLVLALLALYTLAVIVVAVGGVLLLRDLFKSTQPPEHR